jgi:thiol-disulfide isomerase/thioredoxin
MNTKILALILLATWTLRADEFLPVLKANGSVYSNITVTTVTATDVFFTYTNGMGNAKLKNLTPELQKHFNYDAAKSAQAEKQQAENKALYHQYVLKAKPPASVQEPPAAAVSSDDDFVAPKLYARSVRGQAPPPFEVEQWLTPQPDAAGKFILIDFWATWCGPCRRSIPELNAFAKQYSDRLVVVGISDEPAAAVRKMTDPHIDYAVAVDTQVRMLKALAVTGIPHCILIDPHGVVRYEGMPSYLDNAKLEHFLEKYK